MIAMGSTAVVAGVGTALAAMWARRFDGVAKVMADHPNSVTGAAFGVGLLAGGAIGLTTAPLWNSSGEHAVRPASCVLDAGITGLGASVGTALILSIADRAARAAARAHVAP
jgi:hypothetical protein